MEDEKLTSMSTGLHAYRAQIRAVTYDPKENIPQSFAHKEDDLKFDLKATRVTSSIYATYAEPNPPLSGFLTI